ncbi:hypothetical protein, partial [Aequorivita sinensis]|uniref:hypothetical protein n=1 Tax=Aequorivita sinensis TaxID=1382458 RepID=UPI0024938BA0
ALPNKMATTSCKNCGLMKNYNGTLPYRCKCEPEELPNPFSLALLQSNSSIQKSMVVPTP